ncbi:MAG TPA: MarR family transcriptional regulator [Terriglobia bacterium]|nr:MarR family transcriptional regulator [Terriglobia bacterium]
MPKRLKEFPYVSSAAAPDQRTEFLLWRAHHLTRGAFDEALRNLQIDTRHLEVLSALAACEALNQTQIVNCLDLDRSAIVGLVVHLERMGFIQRRPDPLDIRARAVQITQKGRQCLKAAQKVAVQLGGKLFAGLSQSEREQLDRALSHIISNYQN